VFEMQKQLSQIEIQNIIGIEPQKNFREKTNNAEEEFKRASAAYLQRLINEREKTKQN
jgi:hypothetical protein